MATVGLVKPEKQRSVQLQGSVSCSVCLELVDDGGERSVAKLKCGHHFHLDCIGSAFNAKGTMQCPNCRCVEDGQWLYSKGPHHQHEDFLLEDTIHEDDYDVYAGVSEIFPPHETHFHHFQWCPYQSSYPQFSVALEELDRPPAGYADLLVNVLVGEHTSSINPSHPCPFMQAQGLQFSRHLLMHDRSVAVLDIPLGRQQGLASLGEASSGRFFIMPQAGSWVGHVSTPVGSPNSMGPIENGPLPTMHPHHRFRLPRVDNERSLGPGSHFPIHQGHNGVRQGPGDIGTVSVATAGALNLPHVQNHNVQVHGGAGQQPRSLAHFRGSASHNRRLRIRAMSSGQVVHPPPEGMMIPGSRHRDAFGIVVGHDLTASGIERHTNGTAFVPWTRNGSLAVPQFPPEPEGYRWVAPLPIGYRMHDLQNLVGLRTPDVPFVNQFQVPPLLAFPLFLSDSQAGIRALQPHSRH